MAVPALCRWLRSTCMPRLWHRPPLPPRLSSRRVCRLFELQREAARFPQVHLHKTHRREWVEQVCNSNWLTPASRRDDGVAAWHVWLVCLPATSWRGVVTETSKRLSLQETVIPQASIGSGRSWRCSN